MSYFNVARLLASSEVDIGSTMGNPASLGERLSLGIEVSVLGLATIFSVLIIIWGILTLLRVFMYDIPNRKKDSGAKAETAKEPQEFAQPAPPAAAPATPAKDDKELIAVITAAIAASEGRSASSLRVVSFRRAGSPRWNER